jgi:hypothetical protein
VSLLSPNRTALEEIADLVGHRGTATTETVYRKVIVPELRRGAKAMDQLFSWQGRPPEVVTRRGPRRRSAAGTTGSQQRP